MNCYYNSFIYAIYQLYIIIIYVNHKVIAADEVRYQNIASYERLALYDLYNSTNGNDWIYRGGDIGHWNFTDPSVNPCSLGNRWQGLNCTIPTSSSSSYYISEIKLSTYNLQGYIPDSIDNFSYLKYLDLSHNNINKRIPHTIGNLSELLELDLSYNSLSGSLPNSIYELSILKVLNLDGNYYLQGNISNLIGQLSHLQYLNLRNNLFEGTLPSTIGNLSELVNIRISVNEFTGTIPKSMRDLKCLEFIYFSVNKLTGSIPDWIGGLSSLIVLSLGSNQFIGTIPSNLSYLINLNLFDLGNNKLIGTIPNWIGGLSLLEFLSLNSNLLSGTIPTNLSNLTNLYLLSLSRNKLTGTIPYWIGGLSLFNYVNLAGNQLSGTIPNSLSNLTNLSILRLNANKLTGTIPDQIGKLSVLGCLALGSNLLSGTIPNSLANLSELVELSLYSNSLTGIIPNIFENLPQLRYIELYNNHFTGTLPYSISKLPNLNYLFLENNHFSGSLNNVFDGNYQKQLSNIQLSNNQFTGNLPEELFLSQSLTAFSAVSNCFRGSIPSSICDNKQLSTLALDGLVCASSCQNKILSITSSAYDSKNQITDGIPKCLWSMAKLKVLHLSGNSLTGSIPDDINLSDTLTDLSLSYNILTGSIPSSIQERLWDNLDLSHNRISGTLKSSYVSQANNASLILKNNRISGFIPDHLRTMRNISILEGNFYDCEYDRSDLPTHDDHRDTYECGSNTFNVMYYIWLGSVVMLCIIVIFIWCYRKQLDECIELSNIMSTIRKWVNIIEYLKVHFEFEHNNQPIKDLLLYFRVYNTMHKIISRFSLYSALFVIIILLPAYTILNLFYSTHNYEYAWTVSILYLSDQVTAGIIMSILILLMLILVCIFYYSIKRSKYHQALQNISEQQAQKELSDNVADELFRQQWKIYGMYWIYILINMVIVGGANVAYVYVVFHQSNDIMVLSQILFSIFKMIWNTVISPRIIYWMINYLSTVQNTINRAIQRRLFVLQFAVSLLNNIIMPCFIVAIVSPNCFYYVFKQESDVKSTYSYKYCSTVDQNFHCTTYNSRASSTSYSPPFLYSYQCSSDFVTYYAPVFVLIGFISTFIIPIRNLIIIQLMPKNKYLSRFHELPNLLNLDGNLVEALPPLLPVYNIYEFLVSILTMVGLLLTFGVVFPPLAIVFLIAIYRRVYFHKAIIGRYISHALELKAYSCLDIIEQDCKVIPLLSTLQQCGWILLSVSCMFYTLFVFDILGDEVGVAKAYWVLIVIPSIPIYMFIVYKVCNYYLVSRFQKTNIDSYNNKSTENIDDDCSKKINSNQNIDNGIELFPITIAIANPLSRNRCNTNSNRSISIKDINVEDREGNSICCMVDEKDI